eukprot:5495201-Prymnesium_polylepis.1
MAPPRVAQEGGALVPRRLPTRKAPMSPRAALLRIALLLVVLVALGDGAHTSAPLITISPETMPEDQLRLPGRKLINITLVGDEWASALGVERAPTLFWLENAIRAPLDRALGWHAAVAPTLSADDVSRATDNMLSLRVGWIPTYDIASYEEVLLAAPWWATAHNVTAVPAYANLTIVHSVPTVGLGGDLVGGRVAEEALRSVTHRITMVLEGSDWHPDAGSLGSTAYEALSRAVVGPTDVQMVPGRSGWMLAGTGLLQAQRHNASHLTLLVPPLPAYS